MSEDKQWPQPRPVPYSAVAERQSQIEELKAQLAVREDEVVGANRTVDTLRGKLTDAYKLAKRRLGETQRLEQKLQTVNNKLAAKEEAVKRQGQMLIEFEKEIRDLKSTIDHLDGELYRYKDMPNTTDSKMHIAAAKTLRGLGYTYNFGELWKPPLGQPPKHLLETDSPTENAILALSELEDVLQRRGIDNKACLNALAHHFTERAKRRS